MNFVPNQGPLHVKLVPYQQRRAHRLALAWLAGDRLAAEAVMEEASQEPDGAAALILALTRDLVHIGQAGMGEQELRETLQEAAAAALAAEQAAEEVQGQ